MEVRRDGPPRPGTPEKSSHSTRSIPKVLESPRINQTWRLSKHPAASVSELFADGNEHRCFAGVVLKHFG